MRKTDDSEREKEIAHFRRQSSSVDKMWLQCGVWGWRNLSAVDDVHDNCQAKHENDSEPKARRMLLHFSNRAERSFDISQMVVALHSLVCMQWRYWSFDNTKERREKRLKILFGESYNFSEWMAVKRKQETRRKKNKTHQSLERAIHTKMHKKLIFKPKWERRRTKYCY